MTLFQIKSFMALATMLNFTRAADVLHMTQPTLSKMLTSIEEEIGVPLISRTKRSVELTPAGINICPYFEQILATYNIAITTSKAIAAGQHGTIRLGFSSNMVDEILPNLVQTLNEMYPDIKLHLYDGTQEELMHMMRTDELDMAFMDSYVLKKSSGFHTQQVLTDYLCAFISKNHPLADKECVSVEDLKKEDILIAGRIMASSVSPSTTNSILSDILINYGLITRVVHTCRSITNMLVLANCNTGVAILPKKFSRISPNGVVNKPIVVNENNTSSSLPINILLAWKENNNTNCSNFVLEALNKVLTEQE